ncbi:inorganic phosphate transporter, partial [Porphyromonas loveana]|uniref:inorganic phosphate transporter n=1 Tax=Porphyromonas loveana TaxID=1884669 RepID=UPI0035A0D9F0
MTIIFTVIIVFLFLLAIFDLIVGVSNDAVNFLNSAIGAKSAPFKVIIAVAALGVFCGAAMSNGMMEIARHGIFRPEYYSFNELMIIFFSVMITDVVLLDMFNSLGMPTSTTVSLVFELLGASFFMAMSKVNSTLGFQDLLNTEKALQVILAIFLSVAIAFFFGSLVQYLSRLLFTFNYKKNLKWFAGIFGGLAVTSIIYFMLIKGVKDAAFMTGETKDWVHANSSKIVLCCLAGFTVLMQLLHWMRVNVFKVVILLGTFALALAFAGNDLVNFIGVPLAGLASYQDYMANGNGAYDTYLMGALNEPATTPTIFLVAAGAVMVYALVTSKKAHNVIKTSVDLSRQEEGEELFGSSAIARSIVRFSTTTANVISGVVPRSVSRWVDSRFNKDELILANGAAFDLVRASVNVVLAGLLIALGTSLKLPLSTTYVAFMVAMGSSLADRAWSRESAVFRITGVFSVIGGWFITAGAAFILGFVVAMVNYFGGIVAMAGMVALAVFLLIRSNIHYNKKKKSEKKDAIFIEMM